MLLPALFGFLEGDEKSLLSCHGGVNVRDLSGPVSVLAHSGAAFGGGFAFPSGAPGILGRRRGRWRCRSEMRGRFWVPS